MRASSIGWLGTRTRNYEQMVEFARGVLALELAHEEPGMAIFRLPSGDVFEIFGPEHEGGGHPAEGVVGGFVVDDVEEACRELRAAGCELGELQQGKAAQWVYFRAPDGNLYELTSGV